MRSAFPQTVHAVTPELPELRPLSERAYWLLVRMITRLELEPGAVLVEKELTRRLGIGRTPTREALQRLAVEGLVVHRPVRGMSVADIAPSGVEQIYEFRALIDQHLVRLAAARATPAQIAELKAVHRKLEAVSSSDDIDRYVALDRIFYGLLACCAQNAYLAEVVPRIFHLHLRLWFFISARERTAGSVRKAHAEMAGEVAGAIAARDGDRAANAIDAYITQLQQNMKILL